MRGGICKDEPVPCIFSACGAVELSCSLSFSSEFRCLKPSFFTLDETHKRQWLFPSQIAHFHDTAKENKAADETDTHKDHTMLPTVLSIISLVLSLAALIFAALRKRK